MTGYNPFSKGRWYRTFIESDGTEKITESDFDSPSISSNALVVPTGLRVVDYLVDAHAVSPDSAKTWSKGIRTYAAGMQGVIIPDASTFDHMYVYVFGYFE